jgi:RNA polymerase sigma factor (sigma-70 family)
MRDSDAAAITASLEDPHAFVQIFERHFDAISRYLRRRLDRATADDLAADVFTTAFARRSSYDRSRPDARPWLYGITANLVRSHTRREARELEALAARRDSAAAEPAQDENLPTSLESNVARALLALSPVDREVLLLSAWADLAYDEIAVALNVPVGTVKSRLNRARNVLKRALGAERNPEEVVHG